MYNVQMKRYTTAQARARLSQVLDEAERGTPIAIERRGVRYLLRVDRAPVQRRSKPSVIETIDRAVDQGEWTWSINARGARFRARRRRS
jgi:antitoxin (DNA-binding transcriptional repressor) of toxin-antitoxin stability system